MELRYGVHLPLMEWHGSRFTIEDVTRVARTAEQLGFDTVSANDHLVFRRPWLDGPSALAAVIEAAPRARLMTSVALPVVRGPAALAKSLAAIDVLSGGRVVAGLGPGSTARDYEAVGLDFEERWPRFEEAVQAMRALWDPSAEPFVGRFYDTTGVVLEPTPAQPGGPPVWIGSWGSDAGLRRVARLADGWIASAYNTTPARFAEATEKLADQGAGRGQAVLPNTLGTMLLYLTDDERVRTSVLEELATLLRRDVDVLREGLPIGPPGHCARIVSRYRDAGAHRIIFWPLDDESRQLERLADEVLSGL